jgi:hypothetical protein
MQPLVINRAVAAQHQLDLIAVARARRLARQARSLPPAA